jgi:hypothetical protein
MAGPLDKIASALRGKAPSGDSGSGKSTYDPRAVDMSPREANMAKMKALGMSSMPDGGQDELDTMYAAHYKRVTSAK